MENILLSTDHWSQREQEQDPHLILHCPHAASLQDFKTTTPDLWEEIRQASLASGVQEQDLIDYINIEADIFSAEVAEAVARLLQKNIAGIRVRVLKICIPRALLDMNRKREHSLGRVFDHQRYAAVSQHLLQLHDQAYRKIKQHLSRLEASPDIEPSGTLFEVHTMGPVTPLHIPVSPENLKERVRIWKDMGGEPRQIDIIDETEEDGRRWVFGDQDLSKALLYEFGERAVRNLPYWGRPELLSHEWAELVDSHLVIDIPKHELSREQLDHPERRYPIESLTIDHHKVQEVAQRIASGLGNVLEQRLRVTSC